MGEGDASRVAQGRSLAKEKEIPAEIKGLYQKIRQTYGNGNPQAALADLERLAAWTAANLDRLHPFRAAVLSWQGLVYAAVGRRQEALPPTLEAVAIYRELAKTNPAFRGDLAAALNNLGVRYNELGRRQEALPPTLEALEIFRELAKTKPVFRGDLAMALNNLGNRYSELGRRQEALLPTLEALAIYRELAKTKPAFRGDLASSLNNLGQAYSDLGRRQQALLPSQEAVEIYRELAKTNPAFRGYLARALNNLGVRYNELGRHQEALVPSLEAVEIFRELAKTNPAFRNDLARALSNLGSRYSDLGRRQEALPPTLEAVEIRRELAKTNPAFQEGLARSATNLGILTIAQGNVAAAIPPLRESVATEVTYLQRELPLLPEARRQQLVDVFEDRWQLPFSVAEAGAAGAQLALFTRLNRHGLLQELQRNQALLARRDGPWRPLVDEITALNSQLSVTSLPESERQALQARKEPLEQQLYQQLPELKPGLVEPAQVAAALKAVAPQGALLEFQRYRPYDASKPEEQAWGSPRYIALLLKPDGSIRAIPLGDAAAIDAAVAKVITTSSKKTADGDEALQAVSDRILVPLRSALAGVKQLFVSPDGELNRLPFAALPPPAGGGKRLMDAYDLRLLTTGRDLLRLQTPGNAKGERSLLVAAPDYDAAPAGAMALPQQFQPLADAKAEAQQLLPLLNASELRLGRQASEEQVRNHRRPRVLHVSTHGFFPDGASPAGAETTKPDPMQLSGLALAGANRRQPDNAADGRLTAAEITAMDLNGTELTTLSACGTGVGEIRSGEGVYGLQRALTVAGSRSTLLSLWDVNDERTAEFMRRYYKHLKAGLGRAEALRQTQLWFRFYTGPYQDDYRSVNTWGAFQLTGDWRPIAGW
jgi:CHAT domain-containing protein/tetratricopeptide (TPR) repeat protein